MKKCSKCGVPKEASEFYKDRTHNDGLTSSCKICRNASDNEKYKRDPSKKRASNKRWVDANLQRQRDCTAEWVRNNPDRYRAAKAKWAKGNPEKVKAKNRAYAMANPGKILANCRLWQTRKIQATPAWANLNRIACFYSVAAMLNREGCGKWHVDHVIPLKNDLVCGLHVESNLRIVPAEVNFRKNNRFDPNSHFEPIR